MTKKEIKDIARKNILDGKTKQETFNILNETSELPIEDLAKIVESIPSLQARKKYRLLNIILILILSITVLLKLLLGLPLLIENGIKFLPVFLILPIINMFLLWGVITFKAGSHKFVAILTILGVLRSLNKLIHNVDISMLIDITIALSLIGLGFYLNSVFYKGYTIDSEYYEDSDGQNKKKNIITFNE